MKDEQLYRLFKLHEIDEKLLQIKSKAENLDVGKRELAAIKKINTDYADDISRANEVKKLIAIERVKADQASEKIKKFSGQLYDGSVVSSKEVDNLRKEVEMLEDLGMQAELRIEELEFESGPLSQKIKKINAKLEELHTAIDSKRIQAELDHKALKIAFKEVGEARAERENQVDSDVRKTYDSARKRTGTTGLSLVTLEGRCSACGLPVAERTQESIRLGKVQQCESCRRVLFFREESPE
ncbi:MAG: zinc ribbon domain-containing protein [Fimbriimonadaceae bacterium]